MGKRVSIVEIRAEVEKALVKSKNFIENCKNLENPQIKEMVITARSEVEVFEAVQRALNGDMVLLKIFSKRGER